MKGCHMPSKKTRFHPQKGAFSWMEAVIWRPRPQKQGFSWTNTGAVSVFGLFLERLQIKYVKIPVFEGRRVQKQFKKDTTVNEPGKMNGF